MEEKLNAVGNLEAAFTSTGYTNWKQASLRFGCHEAIASRCHKDAILKVVTLPATTHDISETLYVQCMQGKERRQCFIKLLSNIRFLAQ